MQKERPLTICAYRELASLGTLSIRRCRRNGELARCRIRIHNRDPEVFTSGFKHGEQALQCEHQVISGHHRFILDVHLNGMIHNRTMFERLPETVRELEVRWSIVVGEVLYGAEASSAWIARASRADGTSVIPPDRLRRRAPSRQHNGLICDAGPRN